MALLIGIGDYPQRSGLASLRYAATDAEALRGSLDAQGYSVVTLKDSDASRGAILRAIRNLKEALDGEQGTLIFYYSGHGFAVGGVNYIAPADSDVLSLSRTGIALPELERQLAATGAARRVMWIDACRNDPAKSATGARSFDSFAAAAGTHILFSTKLGKTSFENDDLRYGVFTYFLLEGLRGAAAGADGLVTFDDLRDYITAAVRDYSLRRGEVQVPFESGEAAGDFLIARAGGATAVEPVATSKAPVREPDRLPASLGTLEEAIRKRDAGQTAEAAAMFRKGAEAGDTRSMVELGKAYLTDHDLARDPDEALKWFRKAEEMGDAGGMAWLGKMYENGWSVARDNDAALQWYRKSANAGNGDGMAFLGEMYRDGKGVNSDIDEAIKWFRKSANAGSGAGMASLGSLYRWRQGTSFSKDVNEGTRWLKKAVEAGDPDGMSNLGYAYATGDGVAQDLNEGVRLIRRSVELGGLNGLNSLGILYLSGLGVPKDEAEGIRLIRKAADLVHRTVSPL